MVLVKIGYQIFKSVERDAARSLFCGIYHYPQRKEAGRKNNFENLNMIIFG